VVDPSLLQGFQAGTNQLKLTDLLGTIAALKVPGYATGGASADDWKSWTGNTGFAPTDTEDSSSDQASLLAVWDLGSYSLTSLSGYTSFDYSQDHDVDFTPANLVHTLDFEKLDMFSQELRIASNFDGHFNFSAGVYYESQDLESESESFVDGTLGGVFGGLPAGAFIPGAPGVLSDYGVHSLWNLGVLAKNPALIGGASPTTNPTSRRLHFSWKPLSV
jgi:hypothetical protein